MELSDLKVGEEYYTARDDIWATGQLGGRMRVLSVNPARYSMDPEVRCHRLDMRTGAVINRIAEVPLGGIRGTWAEVGALLHDLHQGYREWAQALNAAYGAELEAAAARLRELGVPAIVSTDCGQHHLVVTPVASMPLSVVLRATTEE